MRRQASFNTRFNRVTWWAAALNTLLVIGVLWLVLSDCGAGSSAPPGYVLSQASSLAYLSWTQESPGSAITGQWAQAAQVSSSRRPGHRKSRPDGYAFQPAGHPHDRRHNPHRHPAGADAPGFGDRRDRPPWHTDLVRRLTGRLQRPGDRLYRRHPPVLRPGEPGVHGRPSLHRLRRAVLR